MDSAPNIVHFETYLTQTYIIKNSIFIHIMKKYKNNCGDNMYQML